MRSLGLLSVAHAINHAQAVLLPLIFIKIIDEFTVGVDDVAFLVAFGAFAAGAVQLSYAYLTRVVSRRRLLGFGGILFGGGMAAQALATELPDLRDPERGVADRRLATAPGRQRPAGRAVPDGAARLRDQRPHRRRQCRDGRRGGHRRAAHRRRRLARRVGRLRAAGHRHRRSPILLFVRERGTDRAAALASGSVREAFGRILRDRDLRWLYLTSALGGGGRGLGVVNLFALIYMTQVLGLDEATSGLMYGALIVFSVPMPLVAGWLSDRIGRKPLIIGVYLGGAVAFVVFLAAGTSLVWLWVGIVLMGLFTFAESPQLQALLGDIAPPSTRDASYAIYFAMAFGVGSLWLAVYGAVIERVRGGAGRADRVRADGGHVRAGGARDGADPRRAARPRERGLRGEPGVASRSALVSSCSRPWWARPGAGLARAGSRAVPGAVAPPAGAVHAARTIAMATSAASERILSR